MLSDDFRGLHSNIVSLHGKSRDLETRYLNRSRLPKELLITDPATLGLQKSTCIYLHLLASTCILNLATLAEDSSEAFATATSLGRKLQCHNAANRCSEMQWRGVVDVEAFRKLVHARTTRMGGKQWHQESQRGYGMRIGYRRRCCLNAYLTSKACRHGFIANFPNAAENHPSPSESERRPSQWLFHGMCREDLWRTQCNVSRGIGYSMKR